MNKSFLVLAIGFTVAGLAQSATLKCVSHAGTDPEYSFPKLKLEATVSDRYATGSELTLLRNAKVSSKEEKTIALIEKDKTYKPKTIKNRNRFKFYLDATDGSFDGIIHGIILPKVLSIAEVVELGEDGTITFNGKVLSSTDSYHDGIISYFPLSCELN